MKRLPETVKALLFDKDGTLILFEESWKPAILAMVLALADGDRALADRMLNASGYNTKTQRFTAGGILAGGTTAEVLACWRSHVPQITEQRFEALEREMQAGQTVVPVPGMGDHLAKLKAAGFVLGVATNDTQAMANAHLQQCGWQHLFAFVAGSDSGFGGKPDPGMLTAFCRATHLDPHQVAMVGDNRQDMEMATRGGAGLRIGVLTGTSDRKTLNGLCDLVLDAATEIR